ncbi:MAG: tRNA lysidine(34) synthetase TilS [Chitinophagales bacterium]|nr:tRNA lysidine(34) synthetase TilS [Chitinophagales bacterium]
MHTAFQQIMAAQFSFVQRQHTILLAISGGVDSVVLANLLLNAGFRIELAHMNFQLRGEESLRDEQFVQDFAKQRNLVCHIKRVDTQSFMEQHNMGVQEAARVLRYQWFEALMLDRKLDYLATAHHADDQLETVFWHFFRGTGINGLKGMDAYSPKQKLIRPLLSFHKDAILAQAKADGLAFVEDSSNADSDYTRNFFRNEVLPLIESRMPQAKQQALQTIQYLQDNAIILKHTIDQWKKKLLIADGVQYRIPILLLQEYPAWTTVLWELLHPYGFTAGQHAEIVKLLQAENSSYVSGETHRVIKDRKHLLVAPIKSTVDPQTLLIEAGQASISFSLGELLIQQTAVPKEISADPMLALIDASALTFPFLLRPWRVGDYFYPLGMRKKKKLSRFFGDIKLSRTEKEQVWVIESNKKVVWILGHRIDDRFKITPLTKQVVQIRFKKNA